MVAVAVAVPAPAAALRPPRSVRLARAAPTGPSVRVPASTYRRRRAVAAGLVVGLVLALASALGSLGGGTRSVPERPDPAALSGVQAAPPAATYVVQPGDTFWSIARHLQPGRDPRTLVDRLVAAHHGSSTLHVGERLVVPA